MLHRHRWWTLRTLEFKGVYLLFGRPIGEAKIEYCTDCGAMRFVALDTREKHGVKDSLFRWL